ncbi:hypothetical protein H634G_03403 [Metarhizium anisopliae BRIP 53293]|uniref:Zn(2)-C6 fungal-type domain-containing protein n=1 Tax=Metarhizium anisopliae BRIP 53293 TaxID=1291518 RepID=A0A0D9P5A3_METAN|nr:hypothetical protein H634G_03403 [Metarhizium anisopliae BRIP 53293]
MVSTTTATSSGDARQQPGLACEECRRRKARCDRVRPRCGICAESGRTCVVVDKRSQRGPRKGQLKDLRSRLMLLEQRLGGQPDSSNLPKERDSSPKPSEKVSPERDLISSSASTDIGLDMGSDPGALALFEPGSGSKQMPTLTPDLTTASTATSMAACICEGWQTKPGIFQNSYPQIPTPQWATAPGHMPSLSVATADLVMPDIVLIELDLLYFERVHPVAPVIHKRRYFAWAGDADTSPARTALRSAMRTIASAMSPQFCDIGQIMYALTRRMLETQDACGETGLPWMARLKPPQEQQKIDHERIQAWLLLAYYDVLRNSGLQALVTARRTFRLLQLSGLYDMDAHRSHISISPAETSWNAQLCLSNNEADEPILQQTWISVEEKRRTVWSAFLLDRLSTMLNDQPMMLMEEIVNVNCTRSPPVNSGGAIVDLFPRCPAQRGLAMTIYCVAPFLGPILGPNVGGFATEYIGLIGVIFVLETYGPVLLDRKAIALSKADQKVYISVLEKKKGKKQPSEVFGRALVRPWILLFREHIVLIASLYMAIIYGTVYMFLGAMPIVYNELRGWSPGCGGLAFLGMAVGIIIGLGYAIYDNNGRFMNLEPSKRTPESCLPPSIVGAVALPIGMFALAWTNYPIILFSK